MGAVGGLWTAGTNRGSRQLWRRSRREGKALTMTRPPALSECTLLTSFPTDPSSPARERRPVHSVHSVHSVHPPGHRRPRTPSSRLSQPPSCPPRGLQNRPPLSPRVIHRPDYPRIVAGCPRDGYLRPGRCNLWACYNSKAPLRAFLPNSIYRVKLLTAITVRRNRASH